MSPTTLRHRVGSLLSLSSTLADKETSQSPPRKLRLVALLTLRSVSHITPKLRSQRRRPKQPKQAVISRILKLVNPIIREDSLFPLLISVVDFCLVRLRLLPRKLKLLRLVALSRRSSSLAIPITRKDSRVSCLSIANFFLVKLKSPRRKPRLAVPSTLRSVSHITPKPRSPQRRPRLVAQLTLRSASHIIPKPRSPQRRPRLAAQLTSKSVNPTTLKLRSPRRRPRLAAQLTSKGVNPTTQRHRLRPRRLRLPLPHKFLKSPGLGMEVCMGLGRMNAWCRLY